VPGICAALGGSASPRSNVLTDRLLRGLRGRPLAAAPRRRLARCLAAIPPAGRLLYLASMESRPSDAVRLVVSGLDAPALVAFLGRIAPAAVARRAAAAASLVAGAARTHLSFDVGEEVEVRVGIECSFPRLPSREPRWAGLLDAWTAAGLCTLEQRSALLAWTGYDSFWTAAPRWPVAAETAGTFCIRCLSHLKLICAADGPTAKAYLLFGSLRPNLSPATGASRMDGSGRLASEAPL